MSVSASSYKPGDIRNIVLLGHGAAGKTTLAEAILHRCGMTSRMGSVDEMTSLSDFEPEAKTHKHSTSSTLMFASCQGRQINMIDTPGYPDFIGQALAALPAVETAVIVVSAVAGIEVNTRRLYHAAGEMGLARMIVINKIDQAREGLEELVNQLKESFGPALHCINLPKEYGRDVIDCFDLESGSSDFGSVRDMHREIVESVVEMDDVEMEKYLGGEKIELPELRECFIKAMNAGHVVPILFTAAKSAVGVDNLLHILVEEAPSPVTGRAKRVKRGEQTVEMPADADKPLLAQVFKVTTDPFVGKLAMVRILQGKMDSSTQFVCGAEHRTHKTGHVLKVEGRDHPEMPAAGYAGDLVALAKVEEMHVDMMLHDPNTPNDFSPILPKYPAPMFALAMESKSRGDEAKVATALAKLAEEDPTFKWSHDPQTRELVIHGVGELHLRVMVERLKNRFHVEVNTRPVKAVPPAELVPVEQVA